MAATTYISAGKLAYLQRDFVFLLRSLRQHHIDRTARNGGLEAAFTLHLDDLIAALRMHFNGVSADDFRKVVETFLRLCRVSIPEATATPSVRQQIHLENLVGCPDFGGSCCVEGLPGLLRVSCSLPLYLFTTVWIVLPSRYMLHGRCTP